MLSGSVMMNHQDHIIQRLTANSLVPNYIALLRSLLVTIGVDIYIII